MKVQHSCDNKLYDQYFERQIGNGLPPPFAGGQMQRGYGIFSSLSKAIFPLLKSGVRALGRKTLQTIPKITGRMLRGDKPSKVIRGELRKAGGEMMHEGMRYIAEPIKRRAPAKRTIRRVGGPKRKKLRGNDIFS